MSGAVQPTNLGPIRPPEFARYEILKASLDNQSLYGIMNIGIRPTFENENNKVIEMHIFDFNKNIYGKEIKIEFIKRIRSEKKFNSKEELINQITKDKNFAEEFLSKLIN